MEIADWGVEGGVVTGSEDDDNQWSAEVFVGNSDPRPGTPVRTVVFGSLKNKLMAHFAPAIPMGKGLDQTDLEYAMFLLPAG